MHSIAIPPRYTNAEDAFASHRWFTDFVKQYFAEPERRYRRGEGVLISGSNGCGKTWTSVAMARTLNKLSPRHSTIAYVNSSALYSALYPLGKDTSHVEDWDGMTFSEVMENVRLLIVDDLGHEPKHGDAGNIIVSKYTRLFRTRLDHHRMTYVTTNLELSDDDRRGTIANAMTMSICSLLDEMCPFQIDVGSVKDLRYKKRKRTVVTHE